MAPSVCELAHKLRQAASARCWSRGQCGDVVVATAEGDGPQRAGRPNGLQTARRTALTGARRSTQQFGRYKRRLIAPKEVKRLVFGISNFERPPFRSS